MVFHNRHGGNAVDDGVALASNCLGSCNRCALLFRNVGTVDGVFVNPLISELLAVLIVILIGARAFAVVDGVVNLRRARQRQTSSTIGS